MGRLELPASCSQSKRATNCATPGYEVFQLWSNMWSTPIFYQLPARGKVLSAQVSQGFPGFPRAMARTRASRSQITCATNCATPGYSVFLHDTMQRRKKQVFRVCGRRCGQARFCGSFSTEEFPPQATAPRTSGILLSGEWIGRLSTQSKRATNCATPGHRHFSRPGAFFHTRAAMRWAIRRVGTLTLSFTEPETARRALFILLYFTGFSAKVKSIRSFRLVCRGFWRIGGRVAWGRRAGLTGSLYLDTQS